MLDIPSQDEQSIEYYNRESEKFINDTQNLDLSSLYDPFLALLNSRARILDAGCGSGRDSKYFLLRGYKITAFDASREMVKRASEFIGQPVLKLEFDQVDFNEEFDAIWASASLLHVPKQQIDEVMEKLSRSLVIGGIFYLSFKYGDGEQIRNSRHFSNYNEKTFTDLINNHPTLSIIKMWKTSDVRPNREEYWLNVILKKKGHGLSPNRN